METLSPQSMCHIPQALKDKCKGSVFLNTTILEKQKNCDTVLQPGSLCQCVGASGQGKKGKENIMQGQETYFRNNKKQGFCMKMERKHFAGPRSIWQTKRQGFCVVFLSILKIGTTGPTTGHWTENWSFYLTTPLRSLEIRRECCLNLPRERHSFMRQFSSAAKGKFFTPYTYNF